LRLDYANIEAEGQANYFLTQVKSEAKQILKEEEAATDKRYDIEKDGLIITTTLNYRMQLHAIESFRLHLKNMQPKLRAIYSKGTTNKTLRQLAGAELKKMGLTAKTDSAKMRELFAWEGFYNDSITALDSIIHSLTLLHAGLIAIDPNTGAIKTWIGGIDFRTQPYDQVLAKRQLASAFKPILYAAALEAQLSPCTMLDNDSIVIEGYEDWSPHNYDNTTGGKYSMAAAL